MNIMYLIIGIPGSGKTTKAKNIINAYEMNGIPIKHYEADMFFEKSGEYIFNPNAIGMAHSWCQEMCEKACKEKFDVIISNTSLTPRERAVYIKIAKKYNYRVEVITMNGNFNNVHGVPTNTLEKMKSRYIPFSNEELN